MPAPQFALFQTRGCGSCLVARPKSGLDCRFSGGRAALKWKARQARHVISTSRGACRSGSFGSRHKRAHIRRRRTTFRCGCAARRPPTDPITRRPISDQKVPLRVGPAARLSTQRPRRWCSSALKRGIFMLPQMFSLPARTFCRGEGICLQIAQVRPSQQPSENGGGGTGAESTRERQWREQSLDPVPASPYPWLMRSCLLRRKV